MGEIINGCHKENIVLNTESNYIILNEYLQSKQSNID